MKIAYVTPYDARNLEGLDIWSGTGYYIAKSLEHQSVELEYLGPLKNKLHCRIVQKYKRHYHNAFNEKYLYNTTPCLLKSFASQISSKLSKTDAKLIFSASANPIAYLNASKPIVFWADASFASLQGFYPSYSDLCHETIRDWHRVEKLAHERCKIAIYSSHWAAAAAIERYGIDRAKVKVVPFGANIDTERNFSEVKDLIESRPSDCCKLLFLGVDWYRKGGDVALKVAKALNQAGLKTQLTVVGCRPPSEDPLPDFVKSLGFISKSTSQGKAKISQLIAESHFLLLPSIADCTPIVLCEANSLGLPCLTTNVGGIPTIIRSGLNGEIFDLEASPFRYRDYILEMYGCYQNYLNLAFSSFREYESRLNWQTAGKSVRKILSEI